MTTKKTNINIQKFVAENYKNFPSTKKGMIGYCKNRLPEIKGKAREILVQELCNEVKIQQYVRSERYKSKKIFSNLLLKERLDAKKERTILTSLKTFYNFDFCKDIDIRPGNFDFNFSEETDWNYYAKSYHYPKIWHNLTINIPYQKIPFKYLVLRNIITTKIFSERKINGLIVLNARIIHRGKGKELSEKNCIIIFDKENNAFHFPDMPFKKAYKKYMKELKKKNFKLSPDTIMTRTLYHQLTGACKFGIKAWIENQGLEDQKKIKVSELLPLLEKSNAYGYKTILRLLNN